MKSKFMLFFHKLYFENDCDPRFLKALSEFLDSIATTEFGSETFSTNEQLQFSSEPTDISDTESQGSSNFGPPLARSSPIQDQKTFEKELDCEIENKTYDVKFDDNYLMLINTGIAKQTYSVLEVRFTVPPGIFITSTHYYQLLNGPILTINDYLKITFDLPHGCTVIKVNQEYDNLVMTMLKIDMGMWEVPEIYIAYEVLSLADDEPKYHTQIPLC